MKIRHPEEAFATKDLLSGFVGERFTFAPELVERVAPAGTPPP
jgi:hypothetical protein